MIALANRAYDTGPATNHFPLQPIAFPMKKFLMSAMMGMLCVFIGGVASAQDKVSPPPSALLD